MPRALTGFNDRAALRLWKWAPPAHEYQQLAAEAPQIHSENCCVLIPPAKLSDSNRNVPKSFSKLHHKKEQDRKSSSRWAVERTVLRATTCITIQMKWWLCQKIGRVFGKSPALAALIFLNAFICFILFMASSFLVCLIMFQLGSSQPTNAGIRRWLPPSWPLP